MTDKKPNSEINVGDVKVELADTSKSGSPVLKNVLIAAAASVGILGLLFYGATRKPHQLNSTLISKPAPVFDSQFSQGGRFSLAKMTQQNRWIVMNFWNRACETCRVEAPDTERYYRKTIKNPDLPVYLSVNIKDTPNEITSYTNQYGLSYPIILDSNGSISLRYGVTGTPETFFIDPQGVVRHKVAGLISYKGVMENTITNFISWLDKNPKATATEIQESYVKLMNATAQSAYRSKEG